MQAVILAAGKSNRFYPFTSFGHKSVVSILGKPLLQHTLDALPKAGVEKVVIVVSKESKIPHVLQDVPGLSIQVIVQQEALGMGHALLQAEKYLEENFFLLSGYHVDVADFAKDMASLQERPSQVVLLIKTDTILERYGVVEMDGKVVQSVTERPTAHSGSNQRVIGIYFLNKTFLQTLKQIPIEHYHFEKALDTYAKTGQVIAMQTEKPSITLKHAWDLLNVKDYLLSHLEKSISQKANIASSAIIEGNVVVSDGVTILEGACIKGPCFLGENVVVGNNAIIRGGVVAEKNVVIGATMEVKNSLLMQEVTTHTGFIGDSVIGTGSRLAAGFCSANVRFDRKEITAVVRDVKTNTYRTHVGAIFGEYVDSGINVATMPGVTIGNHVTIGPGTMVMENVADNTLVYTQFQTVIKEKSIQKK